MSRTLAVFALASLLFACNRVGDDSVLVANIAHESEEYYRELRFSDAEYYASQLTDEEKAASGLMVELLLMLRGIRSGAPNINAEQLSERAAVYVEHAEKSSNWKDIFGRIALVQLASKELSGINNDGFSKACSATPECDCRREVVEQLMVDSDARYFASEIAFHLAEAGIDRCPDRADWFTGAAFALGTERGFYMEYDESIDLKAFERSPALRDGFCSVARKMVSVDTSRLSTQRAVDFLPACR